MPKLVLGSAMDRDVCWQLASDRDLCAGWLVFSPLLISGLTVAHAGACLGGRHDRIRLEVQERVLKVLQGKDQKGG